MNLFERLKQGLGVGLGSEQRVEALLLDAKQAWARQDRDLAMAKVREAAFIAPRSPKPLFFLGRYLMRLGQLQQAESAFQDAADRSSRFPYILDSQVFLAVVKAKIAAAAGDNGFLPVPALPTNLPYVSVIICSIDEARFAQAVAQYHRLLDAVPHEIIGIHDAKSLCEGYNRGAGKSRGELLIFSHDDVKIVTPDFAARLISSLQSCDVVGVVGSEYLSGATWFGSGWPYLRGQFGMPAESGDGVRSFIFGLHGGTTAQVQVMDGFFLAARRSATLKVPFDEKTFDGWHMYDVDFTFSAHLAGLRCAVCNDQLMIHQSHGKFDDRWAYYQDRFVKKHESNLAFTGKAVFNDLHCAPVKLEVPSIEEWAAITKSLILANYPPGLINARMRPETKHDVQNSV
jgi:hypothetical protein